MTALGVTNDGASVALQLEELIGTNLLAIANSGGGKSGLLRRLLETTASRVLQFVLDPEDELYTLREQGDYVIVGGAGADVPARVETAAELARGALEHGFSVIAQLNDFDAPAYVAAFIGGMMAAPQALWRPVLVAIDELQRFAPRDGTTEASAAVLDLVNRGRKRGFTLVGASLRITLIDPNVRAMVNNWILGRVGQTLDRNAMAEQLGFTKSQGQDRLQGLEKRWFWGLGPAIANEPVLFRVADAETTVVERGQAKPPTPPAPEAMRAILAGLATPTPAAELPENTIPADPIAAYQKGSEVGAMIVERDRRIEALEVELARVTSDRDIWRQVAEDHLRTIQAAIRSLQSRATGDDMTRRAYALDREDRAPHETAPTPVPEEPASGTEDASPVGNGAATRKAGGASKSRKPESQKSGPHPGAAKIVSVLHDLAPAQVTWRQVASLLGYSPDGGYFRSSKRDALASGELVEAGDFVRSARSNGTALTRADAFAMWSKALPQPAPRLMKALADAPGPFFVSRLAGELGYSAAGGYFRRGMALLRQNGVIVERGNDVELAAPLPGESA